MVIDTEISLPERHSHRHFAPPYTLASRACHAAQGRAKVLETVGCQTVSDNGLPSALRVPSDVSARLCHRGMPQRQRRLEPSHNAAADLDCDGVASEGPAGPIHLVPCGPRLQTVAVTRLLGNQISRPLRADRRSGRHAVLPPRSMHHVLFSQALTDQLAAGTQQIRKVQDRRLCTVCAAELCKLQHAPQRSQSAQ